VNNSEFSGGFLLQTFSFSDPDDEVVTTLCMEGSGSGGLADGQDYLDCPKGNLTTATITSELETLACP